MPVHTCYAAAERTATPTPMAMVKNDRKCRGLYVVIVATASSATPSVTFALQFYDPVSATWITVLMSAAVTGTGTTTLTVFPGAPVTANVAANAAVPAAWRVVPTHGDTDSITYSVSATELY